MQHAPTLEIRALPSSKMRSAPPLASNSAANARAASSPHQLLPCSAKKVSEMKHTEREIYRQRQTQTDRERQRHMIETDTDTYTNRQTDRETDRQREEKSERSERESRYQVEVRERSVVE
jgi:hypothetical protein